MQDIYFELSLIQPIDDPVDSRTFAKQQLPKPLVLTNSRTALRKPFETVDIFAELVEPPESSFGFPGVNEFVD